MPNAEEMTVKQLQELKRQKRKERELQRRESEKQKYKDKVNCGLIVPLTKEESAAKIEFFTLATEQRAI